MVADARHRRRRWPTPSPRIPAVIITTGGTGVSPTDRTPEATSAVLDRELPGVAEAIRARGLAKTPKAALSRGLAGVATARSIVNLPGSPGGVKDGLAVLDDLLDHLVAQVAGGARMSDVLPADLRDRRSIARTPIEAFVLDVGERRRSSRFSGVVRNHDHGAAVTALDYQAHPDAERFLERCCAEVATATGLRVAAAHRVGSLVVGRPRSRRRGRRTTPRRGVRRVRATGRAHQAPVPIWKRQHLADGATEWVGL